MAAKKAARGNSGKTNGNGANLRFEAKLWLAADLSAANCNHVLPPAAAVNLSVMPARLRSSIARGCTSQLSEGRNRHGL